MVLKDGLGFTATYETHEGFASNQYATESTARELAALVGGTARYEGGYDTGPYSAPPKWYVYINGIPFNAGLMASRFDKYPLSYALLQTSDMVKYMSGGSSQLNLPSGGEAVQAIQTDITKYGGASSPEEFLGIDDFASGSDGGGSGGSSWGGSSNVGSSSGVMEMFSGMPSWALVAAAAGVGALVLVRR